MHVTYFACTLMPRPPAHTLTHTFWHVQKHNGILGKMRRIAGIILQPKDFLQLGPRDFDLPEFPRQCNKWMAEILELANDNGQVEGSFRDMEPLRSLHLSIRLRWSAAESAAKFMAITVRSHPPNHWGVNRSSKTNKTAGESGSTSLEMQVCQGTRSKETAASLPGGKAKWKRSRARQTHFPGGNYKIFN